MPYGAWGMPTPLRLAHAPIVYRSLFVGLTGRDARQGFLFPTLEKAQEYFDKAASCFEKALKEEPTNEVYKKALELTSKVNASLTPAGVSHACMLGLRSTPLFGDSFLMVAVGAGHASAATGGAGQAGEPRRPGCVPRLRGRDGGREEGKGHGVLLRYGRLVHSGGTNRWVDRACWPGQCQSCYASCETTVVCSIQRLQRIPIKAFRPRGVAVQSLLLVHMGLFPLTWRSPVIQGPSACPAPVCSSASTASVSGAFSSSSPQSGETTTAVAAVYAAAAAAAAAAPSRQAAALYTEAEGVGCALRAVMHRQYSSQGWLTAGWC
eukprot:scaffold536_cov409-Prasinococcus_capsulatus_cf.AAC.15